MSPAWLLALALAGDPPVPEATAPPAAARQSVAQALAEPLAEPPPAPLPAYPLGPLPLPDFLGPGGPFTLTDLRFGVHDSGDARQALAARVKYEDVGYLGLELDGERQGLSVETHRLRFAAATEDGRWTLGAGWRTSRVILSADARKRREDDDGEWTLGPTVEVRLSRDLELYGWAEGDTAKPEGRLVTSAGVGAVWQRGTWLEAVGDYVRSYEVSGAGSENRKDAGRLSVAAQLGRAEVLAEGSIEDTEGRFPRQESDVAARLRLPLAPRLLIEGGGRGRFDWEAGSLRHEYGGALTWFGRRFTLPRKGLAARRAALLAGRANDRGENERRLFDVERLREQRMRLALSPHAAELREDMEAVYRAQVVERSVPLLGAEVLYRDDVFAGESALAARVLVGVPWPPSWPWRAGEGSVPFLRLDLEHERTTSATSLRSDADRAALTVSLNREMDLVLRAARREPTALDVVRGIGVVRTFELSYVYARGR
ncbi:MAG TPA: hypothetical protein VGB87_05805 [Vicinamibacteria bacterium]